MNQYLVWNIKQQAWRMSELIGYTDDVEFAETFSEMYLRQNTGMFDTRTGDYAFNLLVNSNTLEIEDFKTRMAKLSSQDKKAFKKAIMVERKRRGMPIEIVIKDNKKICPYCRKDLLVKKRLANMFCANCNKPIMEIEEW